MHKQTLKCILRASHSFLAGYPSTFTDIKGLEKNLSSIFHQVCPQVWHSTSNRMSNRKSQLLCISLLISDLLITNFSFVVSGFVVNQVLFHGLHTLLLIKLLVAFNTTWFAAAWLFRLYTHQMLGNIDDTYRRSYKTALVQASLFGMFLYVSEFRLYTLQAVAVCYAFMSLLLITSRFALTYIVDFIIKTADLHQKIAIVGYNDTAIQLADYFDNNKNIYSFEGFFDNRELSGTQVTAEGHIVGSISDCIDFAIQNNVKEIYSTILPNQHNDVAQLINNAENNCVRVRFISSQPAAETASGSLQPLEYVNFLPVIGLRAEPLNLLKNRIRKRVADIAISLAVIVFVLSWLMPLLAVVIKMTSRGPVFFRQQRSGKDNDVFWCIKFRSMTVNKGSDQQQAVKNDARITRIGAFMRKTSIDELPQFFNVLAGHMSICGPRPHMLLHTSMYRNSINKYMVRHFVKPGITGWAQVNGFRGETADQYLMEKRVEHDIWYLENWSLKLDIKIILLTILNALRGEQNAY